MAARLFVDNRSISATAPQRGATAAAIASIHRGVPTATRGERGEGRVIYGIFSVARTDPPSPLDPASGRVTAGAKHSGHRTKISPPSIFFSSRLLPRSFSDPKERCPLSLSLSLLILLSGLIQHPSLIPFLSPSLSGEAKKKWAAGVEGDVIVAVDTGGCVLALSFSFIPPKLPAPLFLCSAGAGDTMRCVEETKKPTPAMRRATHRAAAIAYFPSPP